MTTSDATTAPAPTAAPARADRLPPGSALVIGLLMVSAFIVLLNEMLLGVALPTLIVDLGITPTTGQWLTTGYLLTLAVLIPATGFVMRRYPLRTVFLGAMALFTVGTILAAAAPGFEVLLGGRIIQAVGTAVFLPLLMTTTMRLVPASRQGRMMAVVTAVPAVAPAVGPALSGVVLSALPWRWLFLLMLPFAAAALILGALKLRNLAAPERVTLDVTSMALSAVGFGALVFGLASIGESVSGHAPVTPWIPLLVGVLGVTAFVLRQVSLQRRGTAFLDVRIFRTASFSLPLAVMTVVAMVGFGILLVLPLVLSSVVGLSTLQLGLFLVPGGAMISVVSAVGGRVYDRFGPRPLTVPGALIWTATLWYFSTIDENTSATALLVGYLVLSGAQAMMWAPLTTTALASLRAELYPHGTAAFATVQQLAGAAGGAILVSGYTIGADAGGAVVLDPTQAVSAAQAAFTLAASIGIAAVVGSLFIRRTTPPAGTAAPVTTVGRADVPVS